MKFVARLHTNPELPRPIQAYHSTLASAEKWAVVVLAPMERGAHVEIWELVEQHRLTINKEKTKCALDAPVRTAQ